MSNIDLNLTTAFLYFIAALSAWAVHLKAGRVTSSSPLPLLLLWLAMLVHALALGEALFRGPGLNIGFSHAVSLIIWLSTLSYVLLGNDARLTRLAVLYLAPFAVVAAALPTLIPAEHVVMYAGWAFRLHLVVAILAYALFTVAALHALLMLFLEKRLLEGALQVGDESLPPLLRVEQLLFKLLGVAFILLSATLVTGIFFSEALFSKAFQVTHKTVFALLSWLIFAGLLLGHWRAGWRGKVAVRWTLIGFVLLLLSYVGSKFVLEIVLRRI
ncbi:MAG TPA: cytochrome c biogenesis protein CcsA [Usitatibacteraceae bacterium]